MAAFNTVEVNDWKYKFYH